MKKILLILLLLVVALPLVHYATLEGETWVGCFLCPQRAKFLEKGFQASYQLGSSSSALWSFTLGPADGGGVIPIPVHEHIWVRDGWTTRKSFSLLERSDGHAPRMYPILLTWFGKWEMAELNAGAEKGSRKAWVDFLNSIFQHPDPRKWLKKIQASPDYLALSDPHNKISLPEIEQILKRFQSEK